MSIRARASQLGISEGCLLCCMSLGSGDEGPCLASGHSRTGARDPCLFLRLDRSSSGACGGLVALVRAKGPLAVSDMSAGECCECYVMSVS
jgi:hypothetical protein